MKSSLPALSDVPVAAALRRVNKTFGNGSDRVHALKDLDMEIRRDELLLLVGPSGCGKTTLLSVLAGVLDADGGEIEVFGARVDRLSQTQKTEFRRRTVGFILQQFNLLPTLTAAENAAIPLLIAKWPYAKAVKRARETLAMVGLGERTEFRPSQLSGGEQQRVAIARALAGEPRLIICDEPTASLDGETGRRVMDMLRGAALMQERAIVVVTHDSRIFSYGDRIAEMLDGRITAVHANSDRHNGGGVKL
jgi:putative ABC transport system ATP-binding protein